MPWKVILAALLALLGVGAVVVVVVRPGQAANAATQYLTAAAVRTDVTSDVAANGTLQAATRYGLAFGSLPRVLASGASTGTSAGSSSAGSSSGASAAWPVIAVKVVAGDAVKKGAVLATADASTLQQQLNDAGNQLIVAQLQLAQAQADLAAPPNDNALRQAQMSYYNAQSAVVKAKGLQATLQAEIAAAALTAPADGIIEAVNVTAGLDAPTGDAIVLDAGGLQATGDVADGDLPAVRAGQTAQVTLDALSQTVSGKVLRIAPAAAAASGSVVTYTVTIALDRTPPAARPGMTAGVTITTAAARNVVAVPVIALAGQAGSYSVRVLDAAGAVQSRQVQVGLIGATLAEITGGISVGDEVVIGVSTARQQTTSNAGAGAGALRLGGGRGGLRGGAPGQNTPPQ